RPAGLVTSDWSRGCEATARADRSRPVRRTRRRSTGDPGSDRASVRLQACDSPVRCMARLRCRRITGSDGNFNDKSVARPSAISRCHRKDIMRIGIIALLHESNTFSPQPTTIERFQENVLLEGEPIRTALADTHHEVGGFFGGLAAGGADAAPLFAARALPSGTIDRRAFDELLGRMWQTLDGAGHLDGVLVAPHGATVSQDWADADGHWLQQLRRRVGTDMPIIGTLDPHANLSPAMVNSCHALLAYRTNPHLDQRQRGEQAAALMLGTVRGEIRPTMAALFPPLAISIDRPCTDETPLSELCRFADVQCQQPEVLTNSVFFGFPYADVAEMGAAAIVVTNDDAPAAQRLVRELAGRMWDQRQQFAGVYTGVEEALDEAGALAGPVCLLDMGDNVGGGSSADGTGILAALARRQMGPAFVCLYDPQAVAACEQISPGSRLS